MTVGHQTASRRRTDRLSAYAIVVAVTLTAVAGIFAGTAQAGKAKASLRIDYGSGYTNTTAVTLVSAMSGGTQMQFRNSGLVWSAWEPFATTKAWTLPAGDGAKTVDARYKGATGKSVSASDTIILDTIAPTTGDDAPAGWQTSAATVTLTATDTTSGVGSISYSTDGGASWVGGASVLVPAPSDGSNDGVHQVSYRATDGAGNDAVAKTFSVSIDAGAPTTTDDAPAGWNATGVRVNLSANDTASGVALTQYSTDAGATWLTGTSAVVPAPPDGSNDGVHQILYRSRDVAGNVETAKTATVRIDTQGPTASDNADGAWHQRYVLVFAGSDVGAGVDHFEYGIDGGSWRALAAGDDSVVLSVWRRAGFTGAHTVDYRAVDMLGKTGPLSSCQVKLDGRAPTTGDDAPVGPRVSDVTVHLTAGDAHSGVAGTWYSVDGGAWTPGTEVLVPAPGDGSNDGVHWIHYYSTDNAGNAETRERVCKVQIDAP